MAKNGFVIEVTFNIFIVDCGIVLTTFTQLTLNKPGLRFCVGSNLACRLSGL